MSFKDNQEFLEKCTACAGSGYYDVKKSPPCEACKGTGEVNLDNQIETYARSQYIKGYEESLRKTMEDILNIYQEVSPNGAKLAKIREYLKIEPQDH
jgi:RecJ-like exonuclease